MARHTAAVVNPATAQKLQASTLVRAKDEVLRIIELLAEKMPNAISDLLGEVSSYDFNFSCPTFLRWLTLYYFVWIQQH